LGFGRWVTGWRRCACSRAASVVPAYQQPTCDRTDTTSGAARPACNHRRSRRYLPGRSAIATVVALPARPSIAEIRYRCAARFPDRPKTVCESGRAASSARPHASRGTSTCALVSATLKPSLTSNARRAHLDAKPPSTATRRSALRNSRLIRVQGSSYPRRIGACPLGVDYVTRGRTGDRRLLPVQVDRLLVVRRWTR